MSDTSFAAALARLRAARGMTLTQLGRLAHIDPGHLSRVERALRPPPAPEIASALDSALEANGALVVLADAERPPHDLDQPRPRRTVSIETFSPHRYASEHTDEDPDVQRRRLLQDFAMFGLSTPLLGLEQLRHHLLGSILDQSHELDEWQAIAWDYSCSYATTPPATLLEDLTTDLLVATIQLRHLTSDDPQRRDLSRVLAQLGVFIAQTMGNLGNLHAAYRWWRFARRMADASTDSEVRVWVRGRQVIRSLYERRPLHTVVELADEAANISPTAGMGTGSVLMGRAQALAMMGRQQEAQAAMRTVYSALDRLPARVTDDTNSMYGWPEYRLRHGESFVYTYLGDVRRAESAQSQAIALYPYDYFRERAQVRLHQALRLVRSGDLDAGISHAVDALSEIPQSQQIEVILEVARSVARAVPGTEQNRVGLSELKELTSSTDPPKTARLAP